MPGAEAVHHIRSPSSPSSPLRVVAAINLLHARAQPASVEQSAYRCKGRGSITDNAFQQQGGIHIELHQCLLDFFGRRARRITVVDKNYADRAKNMDYFDDAVQSIS